MKLIFTNLTLLVLVCLLSFSCKKNEQPATAIEANADISILDKQSNNLLVVPSGINPDSIKVYYVTNGKDVLYYQRNLDYPHGFAIVNNNGNTFLRLFLNITNDDISITKISFNHSDMNIVKARYARAQNSTVVTQIWYNDVLKYDVATSAHNGFVIVR